MRAFVLFLLMLAPTSAWAFECTAKAPKCIVSARWFERKIPYVIRRPPANSKISEVDLVEATQAAFSVWSSVECTLLDFQFMGVIGDEETEVPVEISVISEGWPGRSGQLATASVSFGPFSGRTSTAAIRINDQYNEFVDIEALEDPEECRRSRAFDLQGTLVHEIGHVLGIAHPCEFNDEVFVEGEVETQSPLQMDGAPGVCEEEKSCPKPSCSDLLPEVVDTGYPTMWPEQNPCDSSLRSLTADDLEAICYIYPRTGDSQSCLSIPVAEDAELVGNVPFGCSAHEAKRGFGGMGLLLLLGALLIRRAR